MSYSYSDGQKGNRDLESRETAEVSEVVKYLHELTQPGRSLMTKPPRVDGYLDFYVRDDCSIEMEIMEGWHNDFAVIDVAMTSRVVEVAMTDTRSALLRQKLDGLQIDWIT